MIKVLFICHGRKLLLGKNVGKSRVVGVWKRIFIPNLSQFFRILGCDMAGLVMRDSILGDKKGCKLKSANVIS